jgi:primosomal protein N' (replication factor Y)
MTRSPTPDSARRGDEEKRGAGPDLRADVVVPLPLQRAFSYRVPAAAAGTLRPGLRVLVPFGRRELTGFVVKVAAAAPGGPALKEIKAVLDEEPIFSAGFLAMTADLARRSYVSWGEILQAAVPPSLLVRTTTTIALTPEGEQALRRGDLGRREKDLARLLGAKSYSPAFLARKLRLSDAGGLVARMATKGWLRIQRRLGGLERHRRSPRLPASAAGTGTQLALDFPPGPAAEPTLSPLLDRLGRGGFASFLIRGSGPAREEAYLSLLRETIARSGKALVLLPEISLARALAQTLEKRLGQAVALLHGELAESRREREWRRVQAGRASVVCGARSALLAPVERPRLIVVDEEPDDSFLQDHPPLDVRRGARIRAEAEDGLLVYGAEFPRVEAFQAAREGGGLIDLGREAGRVRVEIVDARREKGLIGGRLRQALGEILSRGERAIVFFNRLGYATSLLCPRCGLILKCRRCDIPLLLRKRTRTLVCPLCGESGAARMSCPRCGRALRSRGVGIEAVEEELRRLFPGTPLAVFNSDALSGRTAQESVLRRFARGAVRLLLGTELLARRRDLPAVPLAAILAPEMALARPDFRAGQRTFQSLLRMIRFGRAGEGGGVLIQTTLPDHYVIRSAAAQDYEAFFEEEISFRRLLGYPPFSQMAEVVLEGRDLRVLGREARRMAEDLRRAVPGTEVLGPALAAVPRVKGVFRVQVALRAGSREALDELLARSAPPPGGRRSVNLLS